MIVHTKTFSSLVFCIQFQFVLLFVFLIFFLFYSLYIIFLNIFVSKLSASQNGNCYVLLLFCNTNMKFFFLFFLCVFILFDHDFNLYKFCWSSLYMFCFFCVFCFVYVVVFFFRLFDVHRLHLIRNKKFKLIYWIAFVLLLCLFWFSCFNFLRAL